MKDWVNTMKKYFAAFLEKMTTFYIKNSKECLGTNESFEVPNHGLFEGLKIRYGKLADCKLPFKKNMSANQNEESILIPISATARSLDKTKFIKIEFFEHARKINSLSKEAEIINELNALQCQCAPTFLDASVLELTALRDLLSEDEYQKLISLGVLTLKSMITEYIPNNQAVSLADLILAMLEQKSLGYYQGDLKPQNIRFDSQKGLCVLLDYDQAESVDTTVRNMNALEFLGWCDQKDAEKYSLKSKNWMRHFGFILPKIASFFLIKDGAFDLSKTSIYKGHATTNTSRGIYHTIKSKVIFIEGIRTLKERTLLLDKVKFKANELVLDVGCNAGLLCHYLFERGCLPLGGELDGQMVKAAKVIANILNVKSKFIVFDLDRDELPSNFDTICLFSVIHHSKNLSDNGIKIANACNRILIECRLHEKGKKPIVENGKISWESTSVWDYQDEEHLFKGLMNLFPNFRVLRKIGNADKGRILIEMVKK